MKIQKSPNWIPGMIRTEILSTPPSPRLSPGFLLRQEVTPATEGSPGVSGPVTAPTPTHRYLLVLPAETGRIAPSSIRPRESASICQSIRSHSVGGTV